MFSVETSNEQLVALQSWPYFTAGEGICLYSLATLNISHTNIVLGARNEVDSLWF